MSQFYLYRHIRNDINVPFYIGIGKVNPNPKFQTDTQIYQRAFSKSLISGRNDTWKSIVATTSYDVDILYESDDKDLIEEKEKEFIKLYGKLIDSNGTLANIENGGISGKKGHRSSVLKHSVPYFAYKHTGEFYKRYDTRRDAARELSVNEQNISVCANKNRGVFGGYQFFKEYMGEMVAERKYIKHGGRAICVLDIKTKTIIEEIPTFTSFKKKYNKEQPAAYFILNNRLSIAGRKFCFKDNIPNEYK